jgi:hypothetical protein
VVNQQYCNPPNCRKTFAYQRADKLLQASTVRQQNATRTEEYNWQLHATAHSDIILKGEMNISLLSRRYTFVPLNVPINWPHYRRTYTAPMENHILYTLPKFVPYFYTVPITNWSDVWPGHKFFHINKAVMCTSRYKFMNRSVEQYWYQISNIYWLSQILQKAVYA